MPSEDDIGLSEKRVYGDRRAATTLYVASQAGLARVALSDDQIGRFGLVHRGAVDDVAALGDRLAVATDEDVLLGPPNALAPTGHGPATAVGAVPTPDGTADWRLLAAGEDGLAEAAVDDETDPAALAWAPVESVGDVAAVDGSLAAGPDGVVRVGHSETVDRGRGAVLDVATRPGGEFVGTADGWYRRTDDGDEQLRPGRTTVVAADAGRAHAVVDGQLYEWTPAGVEAVDAPVSDVVAVGTAGEATVCVTADGTVALDPAAAKDGAPDWRTRSLGLPGVSALAVADVEADG